MTRKKVEPIAPKSRTLAVEIKPGESHDHLLARVAASPHFGAAGSIIHYGKVDMGELSITDLVRVLKEQADTIKGGDLGNIEAMLGSQATALNVMFAELARRAALNMGEYLDATETYLKLALRAQSQCRATLETLAAIKNPPVVFAKQANIAHGPQQVNNGSIPFAYAEQIEKPQTELLEQDHGEWLDTGTAAAAGGSNQAMATVETIHGPTHGRRKSSREP
jgi:hypothetical protein